VTLLCVYDYDNQLSWILFNFICIANGRSMYLYLYLQLSNRTCILGTCAISVHYHRLLYLLHYVERHSQFSCYISRTKHSRTLGYLCMKSTNVSRVGKPCLRIFTVSSTPVYRSCWSTSASRKLFDDFSAFGLIHLQRPQTQIQHNTHGDICYK